LIKQMAIENRRWGAKRLRGELLKLGIPVNKGTVRRYMLQARRKLPAQPHGQTWATFLANHAQEIWAYDFVQTYDLFFRIIFVYFIMSTVRAGWFTLGSRAHQAANGWLNRSAKRRHLVRGHAILVCDNNAKYGLRFEQAVEGANLPPRLKWGLPFECRLVPRRIGEINLQREYHRPLLLLLLYCHRCCRPHQIGVSRLRNPPETYKIVRRLAV